MIAKRNTRISFVLPKKAHRFIKKLKPTGQSVSEWVGAVVTDHLANQPGSADALR